MSEHAIVLISGDREIIAAIRAGYGTIQVDSYPEGRYLQRICGPLILCPEIILDLASDGSNTVAMSFLRAKLRAERMPVVTAISRIPNKLGLPADLRPHIEVLPKAEDPHLLVLALQRLLFARRAGPGDYVLHERSATPPPLFLQ